MQANSSLSSGNVPNIISQTQDYTDDILIGSTGNDISAEPFSREHDLLVSQLNSSVDEKDDYLLDEFTAMTSHRTVSGVLKLEVEYNNGEHSWYYIGLVISEDPQATAHYVIKNDLGKIFHDKYRRWARSFLLSPKHNLLGLSCCLYLGFQATNFCPFDKKRSQRGKTLVVNGKQVCVPSSPAVSSSKSSKISSIGSKYFLLTPMFCVSMVPPRAENGKIPLIKR